ncbi:hypothetical protein [Salsuginibacillus kocurii]|nr:hypothetical protein [Salsuginibacillus kocurii]
MRGKGITSQWRPELDKEKRSGLENDAELFSSTEEAVAAAVWEKEISSR